VSGEHVCASYVGQRLRELVLIYDVQFQFDIHCKSCTVSIYSTTTHISICTVQQQMYLIAGQPYSLLEVLLVLQNQSASLKHVDESCTAAAATSLKAKEIDDSYCLLACTLQCKRTGLHQQQCRQASCATAGHLAC
jgi:hypothetical protein